MQVRRSLLYAIYNITTLPLHGSPPAIATNRIEASLGKIMIVQSVILPVSTMLRNLKYRVGLLVLSHRGAATGCHALYLLLTLYDVSIWQAEVLYSTL